MRGDTLEGRSISLVADSKNGLRVVTRSQTPTAVGTLFGLAIGGPVGALIVGPATSLCATFLGRIIGPTEERRVSVMLNAAAERLEKLENLHYERRSDDFFIDRGGYSSDFAEIAEAILRATIDDEEQRKASLFGNLLANIAQGRNSVKITRADANRLIRAVRERSFRQLCILALASQPQVDGRGYSFYFRAGPNSMADGRPRTLSQVAAVDELMELAALNLISVDRGADLVEGLSDLAKMVHLEAELWTILDEDLNEVKSSLIVEYPDAR